MRRKKKRTKENRIKKKKEKNNKKKKQGREEKQRETGLAWRPPCCLLGGVSLGAAKASLTHPSRGGECATQGNALGAPDALDALDWPRVIWARCALKSQKLSSTRVGAALQRHELHLRARALVGRRGRVWPVVDVLFLFLLVGSGRRVVQLFFFYFNVSSLYVCRLGRNLDFTE